MNSRPPVIETTNLSINFGHIPAIKNLNINVDNGTVFGFLGPNGAGKTTTIRILLGLLKQTTGIASVMGFNTLTDSDKIRQYTAVLLEHNGLYESLSADDNLEYYGRIWGLSSNERKERIKELLKHVGLWDRRQEKIRDWSKGMKQKLAIARCFLHRPHLIFLDEPTSGLDPIATISFRNDLLSMVNKEGTSVFLTTHNLEETEKLCNRIGILKNGNLLATGLISDLKKLYSNNRYEIRGAGFNNNSIKNLNVISHENNILLIDLLYSEDISTIISDLTTQGIKINEFKKVIPSLEQVYLTVMNDNQC